MSGEDNASFTLPSAARLSGLSITCSAAVVNGTHTVTLRRNGANTALGCVLSAGATTCTDAVDAVDVAAGDRVNLRVVNSSSPQAPACRAVATLTASGSGAAHDDVMTLETDSEDPTSGQFCGMNIAPGTTAATCMGANADDVSIVMPNAGTLTGLAVTLNARVGKNKSETFTVRNLSTGVDTGVAVTIVAGSNAGSVATCAGNCAFSAGDRLAIRFNAVGNPALIRRSLALSYSGAGSALASRGGHFSTGTNYGGYHLAVDATAPGGAAARMDRAAQLQNLYVHSTTVATQAFAVTVCSATTSPPSCAGTRPRCTVEIGATTCQDTTNVVSVAAGSYVEVQVENQGDTVGTVGFSVEVANPAGQ